MFPVNLFTHAYFCASREKALLLFYAAATVRRERVRVQGIGTQTGIDRLAHSADDPSIQTLCKKIELII